MNNEVLSKEEIIYNIKKLILETTEVEVEASDLLIDEGLLDSVSILYIVTELENEYEIKIPMESIVEKNFKDIESITNMVIDIKNVNKG